MLDRRSRATGSTLLAFDGAAGRLPPGGPFDPPADPTANLASPTFGDYKGSAVFQDRAKGRETTIQGGSPTTSPIHGMLHAIGANLDPQGGMTLRSNMLVASLTANAGADVPPPAVASSAASGVRLEQVAGKDS